MTYPQAQRLQVPFDVRSVESYLMMSKEGYAEAQECAAHPHSSDHVYKLRLLLKPERAGYAMTGRLLWLAAQMTTQPRAAKSVWTAAAAHGSSCHLPDHWRGPGYGVIHREAWAQMNTMLGLGSSCSSWHHNSTPHPTADLLVDYWIKPTSLFAMEMLGYYQSCLFSADYVVVELSGAV